VRAYTAAPSALGAGIEIDRFKVFETAIATAAPAPVTLSHIVAANFFFTDAKPLTLRGVNELLCVNWGGAAKPAGLLIDWSILFTESDD
jgi:hypothetical protein